MDLESVAKVFKALCDEKRLNIIQQLISGEKCACMLLDDLNFTQSGLSYQMKILTESGLVNGREDGKWVYYSINDEGCMNAIKLLLEVTNTSEKIKVAKE